MPRFGGLEAAYNDIAFRELGSVLAERLSAPGTPGATARAEADEDRQLDSPAGAFDADKAFKVMYLNNGALGVQVRADDERDPRSEAARRARDEREADAFSDAMEAQSEAFRARRQEWLSNTQTIAGLRMTGREFEELEQKLKDETYREKLIDAMMRDGKTREQAKKGIDGLARLIELERKEKQEGLTAAEKTEKARLEKDPFVKDAATEVEKNRRDIDHGAQADVVAERDGQETVDECGDARDKMNAALENTEWARLDDDPFVRDAAAEVQKQHAADQQTVVGDEFLSQKSVGESGAKAEDRSAPRDEKADVLKSDFADAAGGQAKTDAAPEPVAAHAKPVAPGFG